jgi:hypothetical protein
MTYCRRTTLALTVAVCMAAAAASAHDFWLVPDAFAVSATG